jgi:hypothetical protein
MTIGRTVLACAVATLASAPLLAQQAEVRVPPLAAPRIDGRMGHEEWARSVELTLSDGSRVLMRHDGAHLYIGVRMSRRGYPSLCVEHGDTIRVLHSSAALADAIYVRAGDTWAIGRAFGAGGFALRSGDTTAANRAAMRDYLTSHGWVASNSAMSDTEREMQIDLRLIDTSPARMALGLYIEAPESSTAWPEGHTDSCTETKIVQGWFPKTPLTFRPDGWARVTLLGSNGSARLR